MKKLLVAPGLSPNVQFDDVFCSIKSLLFFPFFSSKDYTDKINTWFKTEYDCKFTFSFCGAREGEYALLKSIGVKKGDEVIIQAFTCAAVVLPILKLSAKPVYADILKDTFSADPQDIKKKISNKTRAIIVQHTFGIPAKIEEIKKIAESNNIPLIEDCAHGINVMHEGRKLGTYGDASFFSFGRDKVISSVYGGVVITNNKEIALKLEEISKNAHYPSYFWVIKQLLHPILTFSIKKLFLVSPVLGKGFLKILKEISIIEPPVDTNSERALKSLSVNKYPNSLAYLVFNQLKKIDKYNARREEIFAKYRENLGDYLNLPGRSVPYLRIPVIEKDKKSLVAFSKKRLIYLGNWYENVIDPKQKSLSAVYYGKKSCTIAERLALSIVNLPSYPTMSDKEIKHVISVIKDWHGANKNKTTKS